MIRKVMQTSGLAVATLALALAGTGVAGAAPLTVVKTNVISASPTGDPSDNVAKGSYDTVTSSSGRYVAFSSASDNIIPGTTSTARETYLYDRLQRTMQIVSRTTSGQVADDNGSTPAGVSDNGRYVVFNSSADNLAAENGLPGGGKDEGYVRDLQTGVTTLVTTTQYGGYIDPHNVSRDGNIIAYSATTHVGTGGWDTYMEGRYMYNRTTHATTELPGGPQAPDLNGDSAATSVSGNSRYVTYVIADPWDGPGYNYPVATAYRYDVTTGLSQVVARDANSGATLTSDGNHALYYSVQEPAPGTYVNHEDLYVKNLTTGVSQLIAEDVGGPLPGSLSLSDDANRISYFSSAGGTNGWHVRDLTSSADVTVATIMVGGATLTANGLELAYDTQVVQPNSRFQALVAQFATDAPLVSLSGPVSASRGAVSGTVTLNDDVYSSLDYSHIFYVFNNLGVQVAAHYQYGVPASTGTLSFDWDSTTVPNGTYKVYVSAKDSANHKDTYSTDYYSVTVAN